jgi:PhzF family phenazine biosynthesis protein
MQAVARELNLETTFVLRSNDKKARFKLRYFMPLCEIGLCGHGTIGAIWTLAEEGMLPRGLPELTVETPVGLLKIELEWEEGCLKKVLMDQLLPQFAYPKCSAEEAARVLGITPDTIAETGLPLTSASTGRAKLLIPVSDWQVLDSIAPDKEDLEELCRRIGVTGLYPFTLKPRSSGMTAEARQFPCDGGVIEDPVTGVAACALGTYLVHQRAVDVEEPVTRLLIEQGHTIGRPGKVEVRVYLRDGEITRVQIAGRTVLISTGEMRRGCAEASAYC